MNQELDISSIFQNDLIAIRMAPTDPPKASIIDFVMAVTGKDNNQVEEIIRNMEKTNVHEDQVFYSNLEKYQFEGVGQSTQHVLSASDAVKLIMMLPVKVANESIVFWFLFGLGQHTVLQTTDRSS